MEYETEMKRLWKAVEAYISSTAGETIADLVDYTLDLDDEGNTIMPENQQTALNCMSEVIEGSI